ncbi:hypothetical protein PDE_09057 [Penicillium oxalicum 114-2]|uniref:Uncharacterized protein n=1 Tax=Penicillium oxalicum (strain 114-2 / CGMCC 5302) TaxID=933388 RepID=S7ZTQ4_PENO1|nr:hypothetical protein PDE_09057 [Penicillium oxalicum 114-2]
MSLMNGRLSKRNLLVWAPIRCRLSPLAITTFFTRDGSTATGWSTGIARSFASEEIVVLEPDCEQDARREEPELFGCPSSIVFQDTLLWFYHVLYA